jgi:hypothetical protein
VLYPTELRAIGGLGRIRTGVAPGAHTALQAATYPLGHETSVPSTRLERVTCSSGRSRAIQLRRQDLRIRFDTFRTWIVRECF